MTGKDLIELGMNPGPGMGRMLRQIREAQDSGIINNKQEAANYIRQIIPA